MLCVAIFKQAGRISEHYYSYLLRGPVGSKATVPKKPDYPTLSEAMWVGAHFLAHTYEKFKSLPQDMLKSIYLKIGDFELVRTMHTSLTALELCYVPRSLKLFPYQKL